MFNKSWIVIRSPCGILSQGTPRESASLICLGLASTRLGALVSLLSRYLIALPVTSWYHKA
jgi:hypothetical protein